MPASASMPLEQPKRGHRVAPQHGIPQSPRHDSHLRLAAVSTRRLVPTLGWVAVITAVVVLFALATLQAVIVDRQTNLDNVNNELEGVRAVNDKLRLNVARAEAPERVVTVAINSLGMVEPERRMYLVPVELD